MLNTNTMLSRSAAKHSLGLITLSLALAACGGGNLGSSSASSDSSTTSSSASVSSSSSAISSVSSVSSVSSSSVSSAGVTNAAYGTGAPGAALQTAGNPFVDAAMYVSPDIATLVQQSIEQVPAGSDLANRMRIVQGYPSAVWLDRIEAIDGGEVNSGRRSLAGHLDVAVQQQNKLAVNGTVPPMTVVIIVYNLPDRDCAALASNGTLHSDEGGMAIYKQDYIDVIAQTFANYPSLRIVAMLEPDSYPNMITNLDVQTCQEVDSKGVYVEGLRYAIGQFAPMNNVYTYMDLGHSGWLGWDDNRAGTIAGFTNLVKGATASGRLDVIKGFATNTSGYTPVEEPYLDGAEMTVHNSVFYEWNKIIDEATFVDVMYQEFVAAGFPAGLGFIIDTARNGWGGSARPTGFDGTVDGSRVDRRDHRGNWCNIRGAGIGYAPEAQPNAARPHLHAYYWMKPPGESDGIADPNAVGANEEGKSHDPMCGAGTNVDALADAPHAGHWFHDQFVMLIENAYPPIGQ